jgi:hypothetical protein
MVDQRRILNEPELKQWNDEVRQHIIENLNKWNLTHQIEL